ncbi:hypothetical protein FEM48_Zijuj11G0047100 [Ziziphus jujuba var. spinosa]|uniref:Uncharacterized protein n=1 Tax=Ziziphus jujuba var. spinosa TaxID=714518 RepID=A0A978UGW6_ZIZJJ|nr:hypothetical protein FEM48_Zijuj11G0047100 [Ziziphus jujuba var. spinosa]
MECGHNHSISKDDVIAKLKDDGDFDRLRLKIIRKLKDDEKLRENISSIVKQSAALNRLGSENMKPRQLSDAIYQEVGDKVMSQISDGLWGIIRSSDGMKGEITETVQSVYNRLLDPKGKDKDESPTHMMEIQNGAGNSGSNLASAGEIDGELSDNEPKEPPGFSLSHNIKGDLQLPLPNEKGSAEEQHKVPSKLQDKPESEDVRHSPLPGFYAEKGHKQPCDDGEEDPDVPPGFG